ncbi:rhodanese-like domain-containing protein, partial [Candidatus Woesearchaeota archaeon]|nr:rhodanese-like domain-containing protein [Candidatus Woesearchaeota archaeon]
KQKIDSEKGFVLIDVRTENEYSEGHINNSILAPYDELNERHKEINLDKNDEIIAYCRTKNRSKIAAEILKSLGYVDVTYVLGGMTEWMENGYPISK